MPARKHSQPSSMAQSPRLGPYDHRPSISTVDSVAVSSDGASDVGFTTPPLTAERELSEPRTPDVPGMRLDNDSESETDQPPSAMTGSPESRSKVRRSLHRTLRESHGSSSHRRGHKAKDSSSTIMSNESEGEGLARTKGSFTVHGKKASVIQFGPDWHNTPAEERLDKIRKQAQETMQEASSADEKDGGGISDATAVAVAAAAARDDDALIVRPSTAETRKQRHVSSQTITPASYQQSLEGHNSDSDAASQMSEIAEESQTQKASPVGSEEPARRASTDEESRAHLMGPKSQTVGA